MKAPEATPPNFRLPLCHTDSFWGLCTHSSLSLNRALHHSCVAYSPTSLRPLVCCHVLWEAFSEWARQDADRLAVILHQKPVRGSERWQNVVVRRIKLKQVSLTGVSAIPFTIWVILQSYLVPRNLSSLFCTRERRILTSQGYCEYILNKLFYVKHLG